MTGGDHRIHKMGARCGGGPEDWRKASVTFIDRKGKKEEAGNYRPVSLTSISGKATGLQPCLWLPLVDGLANSAITDNSKG